MRIVLQAIMIVKVGNISYTDLGAALHSGSVRASHPTAPGFNSKRSQRFIFWSLRNFSWILMLPRFIDCLEKWTAQELNNVDGTNLVQLNSITKTFLTLISRNLAGTGIRTQLDVICFLAWPPSGTHGWPLSSSQYPGRPRNGHHSPTR